MHMLDLSIVVLYLVGTVLFGAWLSRNQRDVKDSFVSGRAVPDTAAWCPPGNTYPPQTGQMSY